VLIPAGLFIVTVRGWRLLAWWVPAVAVATMWWSSRWSCSQVRRLDRALHGKRGRHHLGDRLSNVLRGTDNWVSYLVTNGQIWWPLGYKIATQALPTLLTGLVAGLGLAGLIRREMPARSFLLASVLSGAVIISAGYTSSLGNPTAGLVGEIINGPASAFRNLWKFDPLIRLPVALGLAHLLATTRVRQMRIGLVVAAIGALAVPGYVSGLAASGSFGQIPSYWVSAAQWVTAHAGRQAVLVAPGASFGQYVWGSPMDDVLASLTNADFAERDLSVIGSPGNERLLDAIDQQLAAGDGSAGLTQVIARMGIRYVVVRNDLSRSDADAAWPSGSARRWRTHRDHPGGPVRPGGRQRLARRRGHELRSAPSPRCRSTRWRGRSRWRPCCPRPARCGSTAALSRCSRWPTPACSPTARCWSTTTGPGCRGRLGADRFAAPPGAELRGSCAAHIRRH